MTEQLARKRKKPSHPVMPHNLEAERAVLGGALIDNKQVSVAREILKPEMFFRKAHQQIWAAIEDLDQKHFPVELVTLRDELLRLQILDDVGGPAYIGSLVDGVPWASNVEYYAALVKDYSVRRSMVSAGLRLLEQGYNETDRPVAELIDEAENTLLDLSRQHVTSDGFISAVSWAQEGMQQIRHLMEHKTLITGLPTGFSRIDYLTRGLQPGNLVVIAGRPSMGKTSLAMQIGREASKVGCCAVFTMEMTKVELWMRALSLESKVNLHKILTGDIDERSGPAVMEAGDALERSGFFIDETPGITVETLRSRCKRLAAAQPLNLIVIDYLQLMEHKKQKGENDSAAIGRTTRWLKRVAKELNVPIILLSQLSRGPESRPDKRPMMSDLRESGAIEQDADMVWLIYREDYYFPDRTEKANQAEVIISKQRNGPTGTVELYFEKRQTRFLPWADRPGGGGVP